MSLWNQPPQTNEDGDNLRQPLGPNKNNLKLVSEIISSSSHPASTINYQEHDQSDQLQSENARFAATTPLVLPPSLGRAVVASDNDVSNGFVKDGKMLPYVFEANDAGVRKRSSKILPVCGVCGKRFVCVTTMKRHLVTHTGEKPFSCKVCGKQYTQKGNLRVHERTHRNDRPFECNICHQKFYRKEPMQKHQWRQHGIVHSKTRLPNTPSIHEHINAATAVVAVEGSMEPEARDYSQQSQINEPVEDVAEDETFEQEEAAFPNPPMAHASERESSLFQYSKLSQKYDPVYLNPVNPESSSQTPPNAHSNCVRQQADVSSDSEVVNLSSQVPNLDNNQITIRQEEESSVQQTASVLLSSLKPVEQPPVEQPPVAVEQQPQQPVKLKMKLAQAYQREILELRDKEQEREAGGRDDFVQSLDTNLSSMNLKSSASSSPTPMPSTSSKELQQEKPAADENHQETVECQCKSCGSTFYVVDPYNFRCNICNVKYTSVPTHCIAEPLQCIGCCLVFPHKPALKAHQMRSEKERPFRCCKCGYGFRQKAHLQKHQWRIHRRKLDPQSDPQKDDIDDVTTRVTIQDIINHRIEPSLEANRPRKEYSSEIQLRLDMPPGFAGDGGPPAVKYQKVRVDGEQVIMIVNESSDDSNDAIEEQRKCPARPKLESSPDLSQHQSRGQQPLDLSPTKKTDVAGGKLHKLIASMPFNDEGSRGEIVDIKYDDCPDMTYSSSRRSMSPSRLVQRENNPLLNLPPSSMTPTSPQNVVTLLPTLKKFRTSPTPPPPAPASHTTLPPILQKPSSFARDEPVTAAATLKHGSMAKNLLLPSDVAHGEAKKSDFLRNLSGSCPSRTV